MTLHVGCWKWGSKYGPHYVNKLMRGVKRNLTLPHRFVCITDDPRGVECETWPIERPDLLGIRDGCYARLEMFSSAWQAKHKIERIICLDLDMVITGNLDPLFDRSEPFVILSKSHWNPCKFNGSVMSIQAGARPEIWNDFTPEDAEAASFIDGEHRGTDQTWIAHKAPAAAVWTYEDGIYSVGKPGWPKGGNPLALPKGARIVSFPGRRDPSTLMMLPWVKDNWT